MPDPLCLIVEDEPAIRGYLRAVLESEHLQVLEAGTASQALKIIEGLAGRLDLIVSDVKMPGDMDGVDLAYSVHNFIPSRSNNPYLWLRGRTVPNSHECNI